jgi:L-fuculose-phosphate aldolase
MPKAESPDIPPTPQAEQALRQQIVSVGRRMQAEGYIAGAAGNLSARLNEDRLLITPSGASKGELSPDELLVIDQEGNCLEGDGTCRPSSELPMHLEIYRQRPDVGAVVHAHPVYCVALSLVGVSLQTPYIPEALVLLGPVATTRYATPSSTENRDAIRGLIGEHDAIVLAQHGSLTVGVDPEEAFMRLEVLEHTAHTVATAYMLGEPRALSEEAVGKLLRMRAKMGLGKGVESRLGMRIAAEVERLTLDPDKTEW